MNGTLVGTVRSTRSFRPPSLTLILYIMRELAVPTLMGFGLFTFFLLMNFLLQLAELIIRDGVGVADVGRLFLYSVPHIIVLTVPMAVLVGGLIAFGRLSSDAEIIAMRSGGISLYQLAVPILVIASAATLLNLYLCLQVLPWGNDAIVQLRWRLINSRTLAGEVRPRVFETRFPNFTLFVEDVVGPEQSWEHLLLVRTDRNPPQVVLAQSALPIYDAENREAWLELRNGYIYDGGDTAEVSSVIAFELEERLLRRDAGFEIAPLEKDERSMNLGELRAKIASLEAVDARTEKYSVEVHKKFSLPVACLVMGLIALPLGVSTKRNTKATGYMMAIGVIAVYYQFIENGEKFAEEGAIPVWLGLWGANIALGAAAIFLLWSKATEREFGVLDRLMQGLDRITETTASAWQTRRGELRPEGDAHSKRAAAAVVTRGSRFPRIIDRYVLAQFVRVFALTLGGLLVIWIIGEYFEISDDVYSAGASRTVVYEYLKFRLPFIVMMTIPIATVLTILIVFSLMSKQNEVVAVLTGGTSLFRLAAPVLIPAVLLTAVEYALSDYIVPYTNQRSAEVKDSLTGASAMRTVRPASGHWVRGRGNHVFNYADYDPTSRAFQGLRIYYFDDEEWRLTRVDYAARARWEGDRWLATDSWRRHYLYEEGSVSSPPLMRFPTTDLQIAEEPVYFGTDLRLPEQMSAAELRQHITDLETRGFDAGKYKIDLQQKFAFPAIVLVLALVGIPFGFRMGRQGTLSGVAVALVLTMLFWLTFIFFRAVGSAEVLPPLVAAWAPHALFLALAGYITVGLRT